MKKHRLVLKTETLRVLNGSELRRVSGGTLVVVVSAACLMETLNCLTTIKITEPYTEPYRR